MDFEKAYESYKNGTATEEEKTFVEGEIEKAKKLTELIDRQDAERCVIAAADEGEVKKAKKQFTVKALIKTAVISFVSLIVIAGVICAGVFGTAVSSAKKEVNYSISTAKILAVQYVAAHSVNTADKLVVTEEERDLKIEGVLKHSYYYYSFDVRTVGGDDIDVYVNAKTGEISFVDFGK